jgi:tetratricopeptide (TPR) repeat protein
MGEIATRSGKLDEGIAQFREALKIEDAGLYFEPPKWYYPIRQSLGAALLKAGRNAEAEAVYREDLKRFPENGWSCSGSRPRSRRRARPRRRRRWTGGSRRPGRRRTSS